MNGKPTAGVSSVPVAIALLAIVLQIATITIFFRVIHNTQEEAAYKYSDMKSARDATRTRCDQHSSSLASLKIWAEQNKVQPPPEFFVIKECVILTPLENNKEQSKQ